MTKRGASTMLLLATANFPLNTAKQIEQTGQLWLEVFKNYTDERMKDAMLQCLTWCKNFPTVADLKQALIELRQMETPSAPRLPPSEPSRKSQEAIRQAFDAVRSGMRDKMMNEVDISKLRLYYRDLLLDLSDDFVFKNYNELMICMDSSQMCNGCMWDAEKCTTSGWIYVPDIDPNRFVIAVMKPCKKNKSVHKK